MRCWTKSDFAVTYHFGHISSISGLFLFKIGSKCAHFWGVSHGQPIVTATSPNRSDCIVWKHVTATAGPLNTIGLAWPGSWPQAGPSTALLSTHMCIQAEKTYKKNWWSSKSYPCWCCTCPNRLWWGLTAVGCWNRQFVVVVKRASEWVIELGAHKLDSLFELAKWA